MLMKPIETLKANFIFSSDLSGYYTTGDFNYLKMSAKNEFGITLKQVNSVLQPDDSIKKYFVII